MTDHPTDADQANAAQEALVERVARAIMAERDGEDFGIPATEYDRDLARAALAAIQPEIDALRDQLGKADLSRALYAMALDSLRVAVGNTVDCMEDEGDRVYFGSTNDADALKDAWHEMDALVWAEIMEDTQPKTELAAVNLRLQTEIDALRAELAAVKAKLAGTRFYIDCEFDGHNGALLSIALVREACDSIHIKTTAPVHDNWVRANVLPIMDCHHAAKSASVNVNEVGGVIRTFIGECPYPVIIADSPVDIGRFCRALSTGPDGQWASADYPAMRFEVHNVDCYPTSLEGAVQHNAWWDAMALRHILAARGL